MIAPIRKHCPRKPSLTGHPEDQIQRVFDQNGENFFVYDLPPPSTEILPGVKWGMVATPFTPAFWAAQAWMHRNTPVLSHFRWGETLPEELVGCLLGGHGITHEMNMAAFDHLRNKGLIEPESSSETALRKALSEPLLVQGRRIKYRYPNKKSEYIASALARLVREQPPSDSAAMRFWLTTFTGIGFKTASWITRNIHSGARVAVIDIHVLRAMRFIGLAQDERLGGRHYLEKENQFLTLAAAIDCDAQLLDCVIWKIIRSMPGLTRNAANR